MKHINFDESTVLREFARIAGEKELIKQAAGTIPDIGLGQKKDVGIMDLPSSSPKDIALSKANLAEPDARYWKDLFGRPGEATDKPLVMGKAIALSKSNPSAYSMLYKFIMEKLAPGTSIQDLQTGAREGDRLMQQIVRLPQPTAQAEDGIETQASVKQADSKVYDVSGETGEDLVDSAHPGNAKVSDEIVETIVEQQEADIDVVNKMPKGTYATLVDLYNKLHKEGHKEVLDELMSVIKEIATPEDIMEHTLVTLANVLDERGFTKAADAVDNILKKTAKTPFEEMRDEIIASLTIAARDNYDPATRPVVQKLISEVTAMPATGAAQMVNAVNRIMSKPEYADVVGLRQAWTELMPKYNVAVESELAAAKKQQAPGAAAPAAAAKGLAFAAGWEKDPAQVLDFQKKYNDAFSTAFKGRRPLKEDSKFGKHTAVAFKYFQHAGSDFAKLPAFLKRLAAQQAKQKKSPDAAAPGKAPEAQTAPAAQTTVSVDDIYKRVAAAYEERISRKLNQPLLGNDPATRAQLAEWARGAAASVNNGSTTMEQVNQDMEAIIRNMSVRR